jgi:hypothetical protein
MLATLLAVQVAITPPSDRSYILVPTDRPMVELVKCLDVFWEDKGVSDEAPTEYGTKVDYRFSNLGGAVKNPTVTMEIHEGEKRTLIMYGFKTWRGVIGKWWNITAKKCFPELKDPTVVKPIKD